MDSAMWPILIFGGVAMLAIVVLQAIRMSKGGLFSTNFIKAYGLILIATLGSALIFADADANAKTGAFTLLGTIAGYLAGAGKKSADGGSSGGGETETLL